MPTPDYACNSPSRLSDLTLRPAQRADAQTVQTMIRALAETTGHGHHVTGRAEDVRRFGFGADPLFDCLIAERSAQSVGLCLYFFTYSSWLGEPGVYVQDLYVADAERGQGIGRALLSAVAAAARARGATHLRLTVDAANDTARTFYDAIGMQHREQEHSYHLGGAAFVALGDSVDGNSDETEMADSESAEGPS